MRKIYGLLALLFCTLTVNAQVDRSVRPAAEPAREIKFNDAQQFTLPNGLKVFLVEDKKTPIVYYSLALDVKPALEKDKAGLSEAFGDVFGKETKKRSKEQLNKDVDLIAAQLSSHQGGGSIAFLKKYEAQALDILSDVLLNPAFSQTEFDLTMEKYRTALSALGDDGGQVNQRVSAALTYGKNYPQGEVETLATLANITLTDLENYYKKYFAPNVSRLVIVGDVSLSEAKIAAEKYFGKWKKKNVPEAKYVIPSAPKHTTVAYVNKQGVVQASIDVSYPVNFSIGAPDYEAARLMTYILGGSGTARFFKNLRETHSYTYGIYSSLDADELTGRFSINDGRGGAASVKTAATDSAIFEIYSELNKIINEQVSEQELKDAKAYIAGSFSRSLENSGTIASFAINIDKYKLPKDYYKNYLKRLEAVSVADIQAAAKKYIRPENAWLVVTGDIAFAEKLLPLADDKTVHYYDYDANPVEAPEVKKADVTAEEIIDAYLKALGGVQAIDAINDYELSGSVNMMGQTISMTQALKKPNYYLTSLSMGEMVIQKIAFDGTTLRMSGMNGDQELTEGKEYESIKNESAVAPEQNYIKNGYTLEVGGIENLNGFDAYVLKISKEDSKVVSYFDKETGLKVRTVITSETPMGEQQIVTDFSDYREVNGVRFPFASKQNMGGMIMNFETKSIEINKGLDDSLFK
ncbi:MAG: insulinase family protein [Dysgonamonadaceae bacterium]|jgi:predicted Zn-dependent peptidase/outer membrane lipoprotein-sorting protein|nr:insulinase family protein [Dysgonamonadaceae bacterium]